MSRIQRKRPAPVSQPAGKDRELARSVRQQIAFAAGAEFFQHRDPLYHVTESFQQTFDAIGRAKAPKDTGSENSGAQNSGFYHDDRERYMLRCFSDNAFQRGLLSGAVLRGTGKMMFISCLKKTAGQLEPENVRQRKLFERSGAQRSVPGGFPNKVVLNRGFAKSAVGLVVDVLFDARRVVENMRVLIEKGGHEGGDTLRAMYPFLDDRRERRLLEQYYARLKEPEGMTPDEQAVLQAAAGKTEALKARKARMKQELIDRLRYISGMTAKAIGEFTDPEFIPEGTTGGEEPSDHTDAPPDEAGDKPERRTMGFFIPVIPDSGDDGEKEAEDRDGPFKDVEPEPANLGEGENGTTAPEPGPADTADRSGDVQGAGL